MKGALAGTATTLVIGASAGAREAAIAALLRSSATTASDSVVPSADDQLPSAISSSDTAPSAGLDAVILEGFGVAADPLASGPGLQVTRIAPGCLCCDGNLVLRVTLNRLLRQRPRRLFIGLASSEHLDQLRSWLQSAPYDQLLALGPVVSAETA
jgi:hypothetical protein